MNKEDKIYIIITISIISIVIAIILIQPYFEMKAFNKFSDKKATYIDALFSNLRIVGVK